MDEDYDNDPFEYDEEELDDDFDDRHDGEFADDDLDLTDTDLAIADNFADGPVGKDELTDDDIKMSGTLDGEFDAEHHIPRYNGYGASVDLDTLTEKQKQMYDEAYRASFENTTK